MPDLPAAYAHCEAEARTHAKDRFLATLFAPAEARPHLHALTAFDLEIERVPVRAREPMAGEVRLQWWRDALEERSPEAAGNPVAAALLDTVERRALPRDMLLKLIEAHSFDLYDDPMPTLRALNAYADATEGALFDLAARILGEDDRIVVEAVVPAGRAQTYVRVVRNLASRGARGRTFVPDELVARYTDNLIEWGDRLIRRVTGDTIAEATNNYILARDLLGPRPEPSVALLPLALVPLHLARLERADFDPSRASEVPQWRIQWALWRASHWGL